MRHRIRNSCLLLVVVLLGCTSVSGTLPAPEPPEPSGTLRVGAAKVDLTPMPGYPMGGYSAAGKLARGVWARLYARAVAFEDADGIAVALVSCDLWGVPAGLADRVAQLVAMEYGAPRLGREQIVVAATHTHHSPANMASSPFYNAFASCQGGFDRDLFEFLSHRIARAVGEAWKQRRPAVLLRSEIALGGIARNRSHRAFLNNGAAAQELLHANRSLRIVPTPFPVGGEDAHRAIDPTLTVIRAEPPDGSGGPLAVLAFYALHPTAMGPATAVYSSDVFGVASTLVEQRLGGAPVALFNGAEGDVSSNWARQDRPSTLALGGALADGILGLLDRPGIEVTGPVAYRFDRVRLDDLARPAAGASLPQGSEADWSFFRDAGWTEGLTENDPERRIAGQGAKAETFPAELLGRRVPVDMPWVLDRILDVPEEAPLAVYRIGTVTLATLPGEFTTVLGRRVARSVGRAANATDPVLLVGTANEYLSYFTTREEYEAQHYEGASTLYGPAAGARIEERLALLASEPAGPRRTMRRTYNYGVGPTHGFGVREFSFTSHSDRFQATYESLANVLMDEATGIPTPYHPYFVWVDANPRWPDDPRSRERVTPRVRVEVRAGEGWREVTSDDGLDLVTTMVGCFGGETRWNCIWMVPKDAAERAIHRFVVEGTSGRVFTSPPFTPAGVRDRWGFVGIG